MPSARPARPRLVLFDLDDTLFDHRHCTRTALGGVRNTHPCFAGWSLDELQRRHSRVLEELHLKVIAGELALDRAREERFRRLFAEAGGTVDEPTLTACALRYKEEYIRAWRPVPGALPLLERLHGEVPLGVITNNLRREQEEKMRACGIDRFLDVVVISEAAGVAKPDPRIFRLALERSGCAPSEAVMVGDAWRTDIAGAIGAGLRAIWINWDAAAAPDPSAAVESFPGLEPLAPLADAILGRARQEAGSVP